jgi:hypothetical protein
MDDGHAQLMGWLEVHGDVINKYDPLRGDGQLMGGSTIDGRFRLAEPDLAGDHHRVEALVELVGGVGIMGAVPQELVMTPTRIPAVRALATASAIRGSRLASGATRSAL